ncbi:hypothetical protein, partial [Myroides sp. DF42-4-2]|uniref:hypothetical protein n=1 Tax=Myroides sp. DF42-4-2 TaxID=2746726 RepID=UPI00257676A9
EIISLYDYKVAGPIGERGSAAGATVHTRYKKDTMVNTLSTSSLKQEQASIKQRFQLKADSINNKLRNRR